MKEQFPTIQDFNKMLEAAGMKPMSQERYKTLIENYGSIATEDNGEAKPLKIKVTPINYYDNTDYVPTRARRKMNEPEKPLRAFAVSVNGEKVGEIREREEQIRIRQRQTTVKTKYRYYWEIDSEGFERAKFDSRKEAIDALVSHLI